MSELIRIKDWTFAPDTGVLQRGEETNRLEVRTASLLEYLSRRPGKLVSNAEIIEHVWDGRAVSPNSIAVVISDIRRALGDDPRLPQYIETLPKRGYLLISDRTAPELVKPQTALDQSSDASRGRRFRIPALITAIVVTLFGTVLFRQNQSSPQLMTVFVAPTENQTGDPQYDPLAASVREVIEVELARHDVFRVSPDPNASMIVTGTLVLWDGHPSLSVEANSVADGYVIWSGMAKGPETLLPRQVRHEISLFAGVAEPQSLPND